MKKHLYCLLICALTGSIINNSYAKHHASKQNAQNSTTFKRIHTDYSDILQEYYTLEKATSIERDYYINKLIQVIIDKTRNDSLPLYGNFVNRLWKATTSFSGSVTPLKKFEATHIEDTLGHINKHYEKIIHEGHAPLVVNDLIHSLKNIKHIVTQSIYYKYEELLLERQQLEKEISKLKQDLALEKEKLRLAERIIGR